MVSPESLTSALSQGERENMGCQINEGGTRLAPSPAPLGCTSGKVGHEAELSLRFTFRPAQTEDRDSVFRKRVGSSDACRSSASMERKRYAKEPHITH
jgi:hypothetical protein